MPITPTKQTKKNSRKASKSLSWNKYFKKLFYYLSKPFVGYKHLLSRKKKTTIFLTIILAPILIYASLVAIDYIQFKRVEYIINKINQETIKELGQPENYGASGSCGYANDLYRKGLPSCGYDGGLTYTVKDEQQATEYAKKYEQIVIKSGYFRDYKYYDPIKFPKTLKGKYDADSSLSVSVSLFPQTGTKCNFGMGYMTTNKTTTDTKSPHLVNLSTGCYKSGTHWQFYKVLTP